MYRDLAEPGPRCARHPAAPSKATCARCSAHVCEPCGLYVGLEVSCPTCHRARRWHRRLGAWVAILAVGLTAGALARRAVDPYGWGEYGPSIRENMAALTRGSCDSKVVGTLARALSQVGDVRGARRILDGTLGSCSLTPEIHIMAFDFHFADRDYAAAVADASRLVRLQPGFERQNYARRALAYRALGKYVEAVGDEVRAKLITPPSARLVGL
jgi:hypothetical protein